MNFALILAADSQYGIGKDGKLPWQIPSELKYFADITIGSNQNAVIMGRKTWESIPSSRRPLKDRINVVVSHQTDLDLPEGVILAGSLDDAFAELSSTKIENIFIIGGGQLFAEAIKREDCSEIFLTIVEGDFECDTFFPQEELQNFTLANESETHEENGYSFKYLKFVRT